MFPDILAEAVIPEVDGLVEHLSENVQTAVQRSAGRGEEVAKVSAPVDTGLLRNSIITMFHGGWQTRSLSGMALASGSGKLVTGTPIPPRDAFEAVTYAQANYAVFVEFGYLSRRSNTKRLGKRKGKIGVVAYDIQTQDAAFYTFTQGRYFMTTASIQIRTRFLPQEIGIAVRNSMAGKRTQRGMAPQ
ncbi:MAG: HK97 gp10 family phage protein [Bryobacteraceae bacterium]